jgi:hypothetical protein
MPSSAGTDISAARSCMSMWHHSDSGSPRQYAMRKAISPRRSCSTGRCSRRATVDTRPSAPNTHRASMRSPSSRTTPRTGSVPISSWTWRPNRVCAPASRAVSTSAASSTIRRTQAPRSNRPTGVKSPATWRPCTRQPKWTNGIRCSAWSRRRAPSSSRRATVSGNIMWVDTVSLGNRSRSTRSTRQPARASSVARVAPATRAPTTIASYRSLIAHQPSRWFEVPP